MTLGWLAYCFSYSRSLLLLHPFAPFYKPLAACSDTQFPFPLIPHSAAGHTVENKNVLTELL